MPVDSTDTVIGVLLDRLKLRLVESIEPGQSAVRIFSIMYVRICSCIFMYSNKLSGSGEHFHGMKKKEKMGD